MSAEELDDRAEIEAIIDLWNMKCDEPVGFGALEDLVDALWSAGYRRQK